MKRLAAMMTILLMGLTWIAWAEEKPAADNASNPPAAGSAKAPANRGKSGHAVNNLRARVLSPDEILKGSAGRLGTPSSKDGKSQEAKRAAGTGKPASKSRFGNDTVFLPDEREAVTAHQYPWRTVGIIPGIDSASGGGEYGTGVLVAPNLVLTNAHVVIDPNTRQLNSGLGYFYANLVNDQYLARAWITHVWWGTDEVSSTSVSDWALCQLDQSLGDELGWMGVVSTADFDSADDYPSPLSVMGYSGDFDNGWTATVDQTATIRGIEYGMLLHDGSTTRGASGGPLFRWQSNLVGTQAPMIYALNSGERRNGGEVSLVVSGGYDERYANLAVPTTSFLPKLKELTQMRP